MHTKRNAAVVITSHGNQVKVSLPIVTFPSLICVSLRKNKNAGSRRIPLQLNPVRLEKALLAQNSIPLRNLINSNLSWVSLL